MIRLLVCGGRDYADVERVYAVLDDLDPRPGVIMTGGARGADEIALMYADERQITPWVFEANWEKHGKAAGPRRNQVMLHIGKPELVVAFPGGRGTADMIRRAKAAGVEVREIME